MTTPKFRYGPGGSLACDTPIPLITNPIEEPENTKYYGYPHFIGESLSRFAALVLIKALAGEKAEMENYP